LSIGLCENEIKQALVRPPADRMKAVIRFRLTVRSDSRDGGQGSGTGINDAVDIGSGESWAGVGPRYPIDYSIFKSKK
jgi:hypothetical protein